MFNVINTGLVLLIKIRLHYCLSSCRSTRSKEGLCWRALFYFSRGGVYQRRGQAGLRIPQHTTETVNCGIFPHSVIVDSSPPNRSRLIVCFKQTFMWLFIRQDVALQDTSPRLIII